MSTQILKCGTRTLNLDRAQIMGILNVTPDSFSDGGQFVALDAALIHADRMLKAGAAIIDIGGESTRPGAAEVSEQQELDRVMPVLQAMVERFDTIVSVDTSKAQVMREAARSGAGMLNDVRALREPGAMAAASEAKLPVCLMHMLGKPRTMQKTPKYTNVVNEVSEFLKERVDACRSAGVGEQQLLIDPGFGFGKTLSHNVALLRNFGKLADIAPVLAGLSRKRMIAGMLGDNNTSRVTGSVVAAMHCVQQGASIIRVHDVAQTAQALRITNVVQYGLESVASAT
ncbi:MAG: dihydropteroate synthase [Granulosicoccus sp.]|nr:dihydropteroate synthase [Granulosicoccus sp.]